MRTELPTRKSTGSSTEIESISESGEDRSASQAEQSEDHYSEGRTDSTDSETSAQRVTGPLCSEPVRAVIGIFSALTGLTGMAMLIVGGMELNKQPGPDSGLHQGLAVGGGALMALGFFGALSTQTHIERRAS